MERDTLGRNTISGVTLQDPTSVAALDRNMIALLLMA